MPDSFTEYRITQDQIDRFTDAMARVVVIEKSMVALDAKLERYMAGLDTKLEKLADAVAAQNSRVNQELADLKDDVRDLKSENRLWRWGVAIAVAASLLAVFLVMWRT